MTTASATTNNGVDMFWTKTVGFIAVLIEHGRWCRSVGREGARANLGGANLTGAYLRGANLTGANLRGANLTGANLRGANLGGANLRGANLTGAKLTGANLTDAYLTYANLGGANLTYANLTYANLGGANLTGAYLTYAKLTYANLGGANLTDAYLTYANLGGANLRGAGIPVVPRVHTQTLAAIDAGGVFDMLNWHGRDGNACGTTHCRAGWAIHLAGEAGYALEKQVGPSMAGALIIQASCPWIDKVPDFGATNAHALADIKMRAAEEQAREVAL